MNCYSRKRKKRWKWKRSVGQVVFYKVHNQISKQTDSRGTIETHIEVAAVTPGSINAAAEEDVVASPAREELGLAPTSLNDLLMARKERLIVSCNRQRLVRGEEHFFWDGFRRIE